MSLTRLEELTARLAELEEFIDEAVTRNLLVHAGKWRWDTETDELVWDECMHEMFDSDPEAFTGEVGWFIQHLHPCDAERIGVYLYGCVRDARPYAATYRTHKGKRIHAYGNMENSVMSGVCLLQPECS